MVKLNFTEINGELDPVDKETMVQGMLRHHVKKGHPRKTETYSVTLKNEQNKLLGCITVSFLYNGMHIDS